MNHFPYKKLWVYGDSFAASSVAAPHWSKFIAENLQIPNEVDSTNLGKPGTSLDHLYYEWNRTRHCIQDDSLVVMCLTQIMRQWFLYPSVSQFSFPDEQLLVDFYDKLWHRDLAVVRLQNFLDAVAHWKSKRGIQTIVILGSFKIPEEISMPENFITANGDLQKIAEDEVTGHYSGIFLEYNEPKEKTSHLSKENHKILADKISQAIINGESTIDCTTGFVKDIFDVKIMEQSPRDVPIPKIPHKTQ